MRPIRGTDRFILILGVCLTSAIAGVSGAQGLIRDAGAVVIPGDPASAEAEFAAADRAGAAWVRTGASWATLEPVEGSYDEAAWDSLAARVNDAKSRGLKVLVVFHRAPDWATGGGSGVRPPTPEHLDDYAAFFRDVGRRLGAKIDAYSPWNEPNHVNFWRNPNPAAYVRLQRAVYPAIKRADPSRAIVLSATLAPSVTASNGNISPYDFLRGAYENGLKGRVDAIAWNAFPPNEPEDTPRDVKGRPLGGVLPAQFTVRRLLNRYDRRRNVWLTELGWATCASCGNPAGLLNETTEPKQAEYLLRSFMFVRRYLDNSVEKVFWYSLRNGPGQRWSHHHGLLRHDWSRKPSYSAYSSLGRTISSPPPPKQLPSALSRGGRSVAIARPSRKFRRGKIITSFRVSVTGGVSALRVGAFAVRRGWLPLSSAQLPGSATVRLGIRDRGYTTLWIRAKLPGANKWVDQAVRMPVRPR